MSELNASPVPVASAGPEPARRRWRGPAALVVLGGVLVGAGFADHRVLWYVPGVVALGSAVGLTLWARPFPRSRSRWAAAAAVAATVLIGGAGLAIPREIAARHDEQRDNVQQLPDNVMTTASASAEGDVLYLGNGRGAQIVDRAGAVLGSAALDEIARGGDNGWPQAESWRGPGFDVHVVLAGYDDESPTSTRAVAVWVTDEHGAERWRWEPAGDESIAFAQPIAAFDDGAVTLSTCELYDDIQIEFGGCRLVTMEPDGSVRWYKRALAGSPHDVHPERFDAGRECFMYSTPDCHSPQTGRLPDSIVVAVGESTDAVEIIDPVDGTATRHSMSEYGITHGSGFIATIDDECRVQFYTPQFRPTWSIDISGCGSARELSRSVRAVGELVRVRIGGDDFAVISSIDRRVTWTAEDGGSEDPTFQIWASGPVRRTGFNDSAPQAFIDGEWIDVPGVRSFASTHSALVLIGRPESANPFAAQAPAVVEYRVVDPATGDLCGRFRTERDVASTRAGVTGCYALVRLDNGDSYLVGDPSD